MGYIKEDDYSKLANAAAIDLVDNNVSLNDSITKLASQFELNQEQLYRLCEATNNTAFNHIFKKKASESERLVDFEVADPKKILGDQIKTASVAYTPVESLYAGELRELPNLMDYTRKPEVSYVKTAGDSSEDVRIRVIGKGGDMQIFSVKKGHWEMPTGTAIKGEAKKEAAARILLSNTGLKANTDQLKYAGMQTFNDKFYHTFEIDVDSLHRINHAEDAQGNRPRIEFRKEAGFELRPTSKENLGDDVRTLEKTAEYLKQEKLAAIATYNDLISNVTVEFRRLYNEISFEDFEKRAAALWGSSAEPDLNYLRKRMKKAEVNYDFDKLARMAGYVDDMEQSEALNLFHAAIMCRKKVATHDVALTKLNATIAAGYAQLRAV
jgi:ADP-ribose pyrophosphatase YjhB (NUDIX family)